MKKFLNIFKLPKVKMVIILSFLLFAYTTICAVSYCENISSNIADSVFRLHVIANSDDKVDQDLKYVVRDNLIDYMNNLCKDCKSKEEAIDIAKTHQEDFYKIASDTIKENGFDYPVKIEIGNFEFPTKHYGDISLPAGFYDALKVEIGEAKGQNWWCVMFPPLCFVDISSGVVPDDSKQVMEDSMSEEEFALVSDNSNPEIKFKFKLLEFFVNNGFITADLD